VEEKEKEEIARLERLKEDLKQPQEDEPRSHFVQRVKKKEVEQEEKKLTSQQIKDINLRAERISLAAIKYYMLAAPLNNTVAFDVNKSLDFTAGKTGPYNLYMYARTRSILRKGKINDDEVKFDQEVLNTLGTDDERNVLAALVDFKKVIDTAAEKYDTSILCEGLFRLSKAFSGFFSKKGNDKLPIHPIVHCPVPQLRSARLQICVATAKALKLGLNLLGIETLEKM